MNGATMDRSDATLAAIPARLRGRVAIVTGAAQGIGRAIAVRLHQEGAHVVALDINEERLSGLAREGPKVRQCDVCDEGAVQAIVEAGPALDILVNCVGWVHQGTLLDCGPEEWARSFKLNTYSAFLCTRSALRVMVPQRRGSIINIASIASSITAAPRRAAYSSTKAALIGLTKSVAADFSSIGIRSNAICPGTVDSPSFHDRISNLPDPAAALSEFLARQPAGRLGQPGEVAALAAYLASDESAFMTGSVLVLDGGSSN